VNPPPWKKIITGRVAVFVSSVLSPAELTVVVGVKRRNQTLFSALTITSLVATPLTGMALGEDLRSKKLRKRRLTVPLERREASVKAVMNEIEMRDFQGRKGLGLFGDDIVVLRLERRLELKRINNRLLKISDFLLLNLFEPYK